MDILALIIGAGVGLALGAAAAAAFFISKRAAILKCLENQTTRASMLDAHLKTEIAEHRTTRTQLDVARQQIAGQNAQLVERQRQFEEQQTLLRDAKQALTDTFKAHAADALRDNRDQFMTQAAERLQPIHQLLEQHHKAVQDIDNRRQLANKGLEEKIQLIASANDKLTGETSRLVTALRRSHTRGQWGEMQLRNAVEMAGMLEHCDFTEQVTMDGDAGRIRPDMVVKLPGGGAIPVDAKCVLDAYLDSLDAENDRTECLQRHAGGLRTQMKNLASKEYWKQFDHAPQIVVMFVPLESALTAALELDPNLHADAMRSHVLIVSPTLLVALLRAVAYGWQQEDVAVNARQIADTGRELYERLATFAGHLERVGRGIDGAARSYNSALGSLERRVLPTTRKLKELHATNDSDIESPPLITTEATSIASTELKPSLLESQSDAAHHG